jgi:hypothetical protein
MSIAEIGFLILIIGAAGIFAGTLAFYSQS